jgi:hypothetical protein
VLVVDPASYAKRINKATGRLLDDHTPRIHILTQTWAKTDEDDETPNTIDHKLERRAMRYSSNKRTAPLSHRYCQDG